MKPAHVLPVAFCAALVISAAAAAELPSRPAPGATPSKTTPAAKTCQIGGQPGILLPGSDVCVRISGSIGASATIGNGGGSR